MADSPRLLSGDNPQIAKGEGDAPVQAFLNAVPAGWKQDTCRRLDGLIVQTIPGVRKQVRWNTPFYGAPDGEGWFLGFHCLTRYVKVAFLNGAALDPVPPVNSKQDKPRYLHIHEGEQLDPRLVEWVLQASRLPGEPL
jgi:hypothetical protein